MLVSTFVLTSFLTCCTRSQVEKIDFLRVHSLSTMHVPKNNILTVKVLDQMI
jgi:hypothetical protein